jgi:hypothetical protein
VTDAILPARAAVPASCGFDALPEPVVRYFRYAGVRPEQVARAVRLEERGTFLLGKRWRPFHAEQVMDPEGPAFHWKASIGVLPGVRIRVDDSYLDGVGRIEARLAGLWSLVRRSDAQCLATGELHRYLAEAVWNPPALLPEHGVCWTPIDRHSARATLTAQEHSVTLDFLFDVSGRPLEAFTRGRYREVHGADLRTPWLCEYGEGIRLNRFMVPRDGQVTWLLPEGPQPYCRLQVTSLEYLVH